MDEPTFWRLIESARRGSDGDLGSLVENLVDNLARLSEDDIRSFDRMLGGLLERSYDRRLWAAAYVINGGCSDDGFDYFRGWLIAQGERVFTRALQDPDTLADVAESEAECEDLLYAASRAFEEKTGREMPAEPVQRVLKGSEWEESQLPTMFPRLWAAFGG